MSLNVPVQWGPTDSGAYRKVFSLQHTHLVPRSREIPIIKKTNYSRKAWIKEMPALFNCMKCGQSLGILFYRARKQSASLGDSGWPRWACEKLIHCCGAAVPNWCYYLTDCLAAESCFVRRYKAGFTFLKSDLRVFLYYKQHLDKVCVMRHGLEHLYAVLFVSMLCVFIECRVVQMLCAVRQELQL